MKSILEFKSQSILSLASNATVKLVNFLPSSILNIHVLDILYPLADLLSCQQWQVAMSCAASMNVILSKLNSRHEKEVWHLLKEANAVSCIVQNIKQFYIDGKPIQYFLEMAFVLSKILWRWSTFRYSVWNDSEFLNILDGIIQSENSVVAVLQLYSSLALCVNGAEKLLEKEEHLLEMVVSYMDSSNTDSVRMESFKLARCLVLSRRGSTKMLKIYSEPLVKAVINALKSRSSIAEKSAKSQPSFVEEAFRLASITLWVGDHHMHFWKAGVDRVLLDLLLEDYPKIQKMQRESSLNDLIIIVRESHEANFLLTYRPYVWDILGGLAANYAGNINHKVQGNELQLNVLIICACLSFANSVRTLRQVSQYGLTYMSESESASRAVLMMVYSPCKWIASSARSILHEVLRLDAKDYVEYLLNILNAGLTGSMFGLPGNLEIMVSLIGLASYCSLPAYRELIVKFQGMKTVLAFILWWLNNPVHVKRAALVSHLRDPFSDRSCCVSGIEDWEGEDVLLIFSLWILAELLNHFTDGKVHPSDSQIEFSKSQLIEELEAICRNHSAHGSRWYAAYVLSYFGLYGFPSTLGKRIGKSLGVRDHSNINIVLVNEESVHVHEVILAVRCPSLLPPGTVVPDEKSSNGVSTEFDIERNITKAVHLSAHVDQQSLLKLLEYVYSGYLQAEEGHVRKLKVISRHCKLEPLVQMLSKRNPKWGIPLPSFDLSPALRPGGLHFSDLIFEASSTMPLVNWKCNSCSSLVPHLHVHKVIVESSCDYLRALFQSGMRESHLQVVKVPGSWESLNKLVSWFYSEHLPVPTFDCLWESLDPEIKLQEIQTYIELCWLAEFWFIEDLHEECYEVVISCLDSTEYLSTKVIQTAANFSQWRLAQVAADHMAPSYHRLRNSGELDGLDNNLVEMVRAASVRLSRESAQLR
ncbi:BTB/POZ domain-containing protein At1g04390-like isoform X2 [Salvia splendens]|nr:BTB/POZ domain-containing protein At1g04390-like isoform X2 [Salvia splendens]